MKWLEKLKAIWRSITETDASVGSFEQAGGAGSPGLAFMKLAVQEAEAGELDLALQHFQQAIIIEPERADIYTNLGIVFAKAGRLEEAQQQFQYACELEPHRPIHYVLWGACLIDLGDLDTATEKYNHAISLKPRHPEPWVNWAMALSRTGYLKDAQAKLQRALQLNPSYAPAFYLSGAIWAEEKNYEEALNKLEFCLKYDASHYDALFLSALMKHRLSRHEEAIEILNRLQDSFPERAKIAHLLGDCHLSLERFSEAELFLTEAYCLDPESTEIQLSQARLLESMDRIEEALQAYERLSEQHPTPQYLYAVWAKALLYCGEWDHALAILHHENPSHLDDDDARNWYETACTLYHRLHDAQSLEQTLQEAEARFPNHAGFLVAHALLKNTKGHYSQALSLLKKAIEVEDSHRLATLNFGVLSLQLYEEDVALRYFRRLYRDNTSDSAIMFGYALAQLAKGHWQDAQTKFQSLCGASDFSKTMAYSALLYVVALHQPEKIEAILTEASTYMKGMMPSRLWDFVKTVANFELGYASEDLKKLREVAENWHDLQKKLPDLKGHPLEEWKEYTPWHLWVFEF